MGEASPIPPPALANARVLEYAVLGHSVSYSGHSSLFVDGKELGPVPCLAICETFNETGVLLLYCDRDWTVLGVAGYASLREAKKHAERTYPGVSAHWAETHVTEAEAKRYLEGRPENLRCSFCGKGPDEVNQLIEKRGLGICDSCIVELHQMLRERS